MTHYVARELLALQVPPAYAKPFRQSHKNDFQLILKRHVQQQREWRRVYLINTTR
jgi:hypothetical protein